MQRGALGDPWPKRQSGGVAQGPVACRCHVPTDGAEESCTVYSVVIGSRQNQARAELSTRARFLMAAETLLLNARSKYLYI